MGETLREQIERASLAPAFLLRRMVPRDEAFVFSAWERGAYACPPYSRVPWQRFKTGFRPVMAAKARDVTVLCHPDDPDALLGFVARGGPGVFHWVYVVGPFRRKGLARAAIRELGVDPVFMTEVSPQFERWVSKGVVFDPWAT